MRRLRLGALVAASTFLLCPPLEAAGTPSCKECVDWDACRDDLIRQKRALRAVYEQLAAQWEIRYVDTSVEGVRRPLDVVDLLSIDEASWPRLLGDLREHFEEFEVAEDLATRDIPPPRFCGLGSIAIEMETDSVTCVIDPDKMMLAKQALPCREIYDRALDHEVFHLKQCLNRRGKRPITSRLLTPAGKAREEAQAYAQEIEELAKVEGAKIRAPGPVREDRPLKALRVCFPLME
jgi:hypothetical protein